ncbi:MAG: IS91 family transposase [Candidatus Cloacimonadota bacterium]|nr:IS91 family transposase [Candidatus Cloacimonadota bacterium]
MEIADIFNQYFDKYLAKFRDKIPYNHLKTANDIMTCRTRIKGGDVYYCENCKSFHYSYHSCKNRHCPKCGSKDSEKWVEKQKEKLLPVEYFMVTFTVPQELRFVIRSNQKLFYSILFQAAAESLKDILSNPKYAGGKSGFTAILHTWTRMLIYHPHLHFIVPGGAFDFEKNIWNKIKYETIPVRKLSKKVREKFCFLLKKKNPDIFKAIPKKIWKSGFNTHSEPVGNGESTLKYLANYVYKTAISNNRIVSLENGKVTFSYKDSKTGDTKLVKIPVFEFMRRFLQHTLPKRFQRIRHYGFLSSGGRKKHEHICLYFNFTQYKRPKTKQKSDELKTSDRFFCPKCHKKMKHHHSLGWGKRAPPLRILTI